MNRKIHKISGLIAGVVILILSITGFFLDHYNWKFLHTITLKYVPSSVYKLNNGNFYSYLINPNDEKVIELLFKATIHHKWQFTKFGRDNVRLLLKKPEYRTIVEKIAATSDETMKELYWKFLNEK